MKRKTKSATIPSGYLDAWARLFTRSPAELEEQRRASSPAMTGSKQNRITPTNSRNRGVA